MNGQISSYMERLCHDKDVSVASCDSRSSSVQVLKAPVPTDLYDKLNTLALIYNGDAHCIAGDLLAIALNEAFACMSEQERAHLEEVRERVAHDAARRHMEEARFDPGCT